MSNPALLYLPLLNHEQLEVRRQAGRILLATYGERGLTYLRRLLDDFSPEVRNQARSALLAVGEVSGLQVDLRPFRGIYVQTFSGLEVFIDSHQVEAEEWGNVAANRAGARKVRTLFAFLVNCGERGATRSEIAEAIWGGPTSTVNISRTLGGLREVLTALAGEERTNQLLRAGRERVALNPSVYHSDVDIMQRTFHAAVAREYEQGLESAGELYRQALNLYTGPYMEGVQSSGEWLRERAEQLANFAVSAAERLAEQSYQSRNFQRCRDYCLRGLHIDPSDEGLTVWMLRACAELGLLNEVTSAYRRYLTTTETRPSDSSNLVVQAFRALKRHASP